jgi:type III pantothenate kinase
VLGLFEGTQLIERWRVATQRHLTADDLASTLQGLLDLRGLERSRIDAVAVSSTVPALGLAWAELAEVRLDTVPLVIGPDVDTGMPVLIDNPAEVGPDRIVNSVAAHALVGGPCISVDFGTSTNFDAVSAAGEYLGGALAPGVEISMEALFGRAARLFKVDLSAPRTAIGRSTRTALQSGAVFGFAGQVDGIVERMRAELGGEAATVATGGLAGLIVPHTRTLVRHEPDLTLNGLRLVWERTRERHAPASGGYPPA